MACRLSCLVASVFIIGMIYSTNVTENSGVLRKYREQLPVELNERYEKITSERRGIYYRGYVYGLILSLFVIFLNTTRRISMSNGTMVCLVVSISFLTNYFYYLLSPKSDWMLNHIKDPEQTKAWLHMYRSMQVYYHGGLALGLIAVGVFAFAFRC